MQKAGDFIPRLFDKKNYYHPKVFVLMLLHLGLQKLI